MISGESGARSVHQVDFSESTLNVCWFASNDDLSMFSVTAKVIELVSKSCVDQT